jgi:hypothetical protein
MKLVLQNKNNGYELVTEDNLCRFNSESAEHDGHYILYSQIRAIQEKTDGIIFGIAHTPEEADRRLHERTLEYGLRLTIEALPEPDHNGYPIIFDRIEDKTKYAKKQT